MYKQFHKHLHIGNLIIDFYWLHGHYDLTISISSKNWK